MRIHNTTADFVLKSTVASWIFINLCYSHKYETEAEY